MALSKLAILLIAGIGSVVVVGGISAGVIVSRQNSTQSIDSSSDQFNEPNRSDSLNTPKEKITSGEMDQLMTDQPSISSEISKRDKDTKQDTEKKELEKKNSKEDKQELSQHLEPESEQKAQEDKGVTSQEKGIRTMQDNRAEKPVVVAKPESDQAAKEKGPEEEATLLGTDDNRRGASVVEVEEKVEDQEK